MGCGGSKASENATPPSVVAEPIAVAKGVSKSTLETDDLEQVKAHRTSVRYQAKEVDKDRGSRSTGNQRRSSAPFDKAHIGTKTRHGVMPGPRGIANAKINQDRGVVCWPFAGSLNEALLCVFDGHGPKGEKASEFCMTHLPEMLENDHAALVADPVACLTKNICELDKKLFASSIGHIAMSCGTTSNVLYMKGDDVWSACSGDSRAIKATRTKGKVVAVDLSNDHKPDLPEERKRIEAAGGKVTPSGPGGRPSRVWANGRVGLAMSRSIGDGECKKVGVIPDPEVQHFKLSPPADRNDAASDGDLFIVLASDGGWEFIPSQEAAELVAAEPHATEACEMLVRESAERWRSIEGNYRDDITAVITFLPFLEDWGGDYSPDGEEEHEIYINKGTPGLARIKGSGSSEAVATPAKDTADASASASEGNDEAFAARRLSVHNPFGDDDDDWEKLGEEEDED